MIVEKCPAYTRSGGCTSLRTRETECYKCKDCEIKQLVNTEATKIVRKILGVVEN